MTRSPFLLSPPDPAPDDSAGLDFFLEHPERTVEFAHYLRQSAISQRRQLPWLNRSWFRNQDFVLHPPWKR